MIGLPIFSRFNRIKKIKIREQLIKMLRRKDLLNWLSLFLLYLLVFVGQSSAERKQYVWKGVDRIVAVADLHGDYDNFEQILKGTGIIDRNLVWTGGKTHLVQLGDIMDRGPAARNIFDLLIRLEKEAEAAGGRVHVLLGNHEEVNILGMAFRFRGYMTWKQFVSFLPEKYVSQKEASLRRKYLNQPDHQAALEKERETLWTDIRDKDKRAQKKYNDNYYKLYGKWLLTKNIVIKLNDIIFVHGGISEKYSTWSLKDMNEMERRELSLVRRQEPITPQILYRQDGPLWYRGLIQNEEEEYSPILDRTLNNLKANHIVMGHTVRQPGNNGHDRDFSRFEGRVWGIDTGISDYYYGNLMALVIENGEFKVWSKKTMDELKGVFQLIAVLWKMTGAIG